MGVPQAPRAGDGSLRDEHHFATCFVRKRFPHSAEHRLVPALLLTPSSAAMKVRNSPEPCPACAVDLAPAAGIRSTSLRAISSKAALVDVDVSAPGQELAVCVVSALPADPCASELDACL
jgi:hypothetical protein